MALDATVGGNNSNVYVLLAFIDTHHADRNNTRWTDFTVPEKEAATIRATDYINKRFGRRFRGERMTKSQSLEWPRLSAFDDDGFLLNGIDDIPRQLQKATAEYALRAAICGVLAPDPIAPIPKQSLETGAGARDTDVVTGQVTRKRDKVGPLEEERWFETDSQAAKNLGASSKSIQSMMVNDLNIPEYPEADMWIEELLHPATIQLARA